MARHIEEVSEVVQRANLPMIRMLVGNVPMALQIVPLAGLEHAQNFDTFETSRDISRAKVGFVGRQSAPGLDAFGEKLRAHLQGDSYKLGRPLQSVAAPPSAGR